MSDTPQVLLAHHLKALRLPTFLREYDKLARQCAAEGVDHSRYLLRLAELEMIDRERRTVERRIKEAKFPAVKSLDSFDGVSIWREPRVLASLPERGTPGTLHDSKGRIRREFRARFGPNRKASELESLSAVSGLKSFRFPF
jgi:hypothetical protein